VTYVLPVVAIGLGALALDDHHRDQMIWRLGRADER
jgi:hypothetical protein